MIFSEVIKIKDGVFYHLPYHLARINRTSTWFYGKGIDLDLHPGIIPEDRKTGLVKCRLEYSDRLLSVNFSPYAIRIIRHVKMVTDNTIEYPYKSADRRRLTELREQSGCDEVLIVKDGFLTDASAFNLVLADPSGFYTPDTFLLPGTKRAFLLDQKLIRERVIRAEDLPNYSKVYLVNAMTDLEDDLSIPAGEIRGLPVIRIKNV